MCERTAWRICPDNQWLSVLGKKRGKNGKRPGPPVHDDLVQRDFSADDVNALWLTDITEHRTREGKLYLCAIKDAFSGRILGYSIDSRRKARLAVNALDSAVSRHGDAAGFKKSGGREPRGLTPRLSPKRASVPTSTTSTVLTPPAGTSRRSHV